MKSKVVLSLMITGFICVGLIAPSFAQTVPAAPVSNTEAPVTDVAKKDSTVKPKKAHGHAHRKAHRAQKKADKAKAKAEKKAKSEAAASTDTGAQVNKVNN